MWHTCDLAEILPGRYILYIPDDVTCIDGGDDRVDAFEFEVDGKKKMSAVHILTACLLSRNAGDAFYEQLKDIKGHLIIVGGKNVQEAVGMFANCAASLDLTYFDTSSLNDMRYMFYSCKSPYILLKTAKIKPGTQVDKIFKECKAKVDTNDKTLLKALKTR